MQSYSKADQHIHLLCQIIAKANRTFLQKKEDDSHTNLYFDSIGNRIVGRWIETPNGKLILSLNLSNLHYEWLNTSLKLEKSFISIGKTVENIEQEIEDFLFEINVNASGFRNELQYEITKYIFSNDPVNPINSTNVNEWKYFRHIANDACSWMLGFLHQEGEVRIWPHHFDTGIYVIPNERIGIGFGLAMEDEMVGSPYLYLSGYPQNENIDYSNVPVLKHGKWEIGEHWKGAVLPLPEIAQLSERQTREIIFNFIITVSSWFLLK